MPPSKEPFEQLYDRARSWWREYLTNPETGGVMLQADVARGLQVTPAIARRVLVRAVEDGVLIRRGVNLGYMLPEVVGGSVHLGTVLAAARACLDPEFQPKRGRAPTDRLIRVERFSESQLEKVSAAAAVIVWGLGYERGEFELVGPEHLVWEPDPVEYDGGKRGRFPLVERVAEWSDAKARGEHRGDAPWHPEMNADARAAHVAGTRLIMNFAATRGWVRLSDAPVAELRTYAAPWQAWIEEKSGTLQETARSLTQKFNLLDGCRVLARFATATGAVNPATVNWAATIQALEEAALGAERSLATSRWKNARSAYRSLRELGLIVGPTWGAGDRKAHGIVTGAIFKAGAEHGDFSAWPSWLAEGRYGIRGWRTWADQQTTPSKLREEGLPEREYVAPTTQEQDARAEAAARERRSLFACRPSTLIRYTRYLSSLAGFAESAAAREAGITPIGDGLVRLCDIALLDAYASWWSREHGLADAKQERAPWLHGLGKTLALVASPYLEARAKQAGDEALAAQLRTVSRTIFRFAKRHQPARHAVRSADAKIAPWQTDGGVAYDKLRAIRDQIAADVERLGGGPVVDQIAAIQSGTFTCLRPRDWSLSVRDAVIFTLQLRLPLRPDNVAALCLPTTPRRQDGSFRYTGNHPWEGALTVEYTDTEMKMGEPFRGPIILASETGAEDAEADLRRDLWQLWLMPGGARDRVRMLEAATSASPSRLVNTRILFPAYGRHGSREERASRVAGGLFFSGTSLLAMVKARIIQHGPSVGLDVRTALATYGATGDHFFRHALSTWADTHGEGPNAARLLGHRRRDNTTLDHYTDQSAMSVSIDEMRRRAQAKSLPAASSRSGESDRGLVVGATVIASLARALASGDISVREFSVTMQALGAGTQE